MAVFEQPLLKHWLDKGWSVAEGAEQPLSAVNGRRLGDATAAVLLGPKNRFGATYFQVFLIDAQKRFGEPPAVVGLYHSGPYASYNWIEIISLAQRVTFAPATAGADEVLDTCQAGLDRALLKGLADVIPPGGHLMMEYDSPEQAETARGLGLNIPPVATPLGYLLYSIGCRAGFRDWYIAEGGSEGPRKLQGYKPLNEVHGREKARGLARQLLEFLTRPLSSGKADIEESARERAVMILSGMDVDDSGLQYAIREALASRRTGDAEAG
jgi:hypothetical protein